MQAQYSSHSAGIRGAAFNKADNGMVTADSSGRLIGWGEYKFVLEHGSPLAEGLNPIQVADGQVAVAGQDGKLAIYSLTPPNQHALLTHPGQTGNSDQRDMRRITHFKFDTGSLIASYADGQVLRWSGNDLTSAQPVELHPSGTEYYFDTFTINDEQTHIFGLVSLTEQQGSEPNLQLGWLPINGDQNIRVNKTDVNFNSAPFAGVPWRDKIVTVTAKKGIVIISPTSTDEHNFDFNEQQFQINEQVTHTHVVRVINDELFLLLDPAGSDKAFHWDLADLEQTTANVAKKHALRQGTIAIIPTGTENLFQAIDSSGYVTELPLDSDAALGRLESLLEQAPLHEELCKRMTDMPDRIVWLRNWFEKTTKFYDRWTTFKKNCDPATEQ